MLLTDHIALDATTGKRTTQGFLVAQPRVARTGIQDYTAGELGLKDRAASDIIKVFRSEAEVFSADSLRSFSVIDVTVDHPSQMVDSKNWRDLSVGHTGESALRDGEHLRLPMIVKDQRAIDAVDAGKAELSVGYTCDLAFEPGEHNGQAYDAVQKNIRANHLALCDRARGGPLLRIGDHQGDPAVTLKTITFDGLQVADVSSAAEALINKLSGQLTDAQGKLATAQTEVATHATTITTKDAEIATLKTQLADTALTPAKLQDAAKAYALVVAQGKALGATVTDGMDTDAIKAAVVSAKLGDTAKNWTVDQISTSFATLAAAVMVDDAAGDPLRQVLGDGAVNVADAEQKFRDAQARAAEQRRNAWKTPTPGAAA